jgi:hypothetical protein
VLLSTFLYLSCDPFLSVVSQYSSSLPFSATAALLACIYIELNCDEPHPLLLVRTLPPPPVTDEGPEVRTYKLLLFICCPCEMIESCWN